jgi:homoserine O-succinyltransferase/O-acetyltransferase
MPVTIFTTQPEADDSRGERGSKALSQRTVPAHEELVIGLLNNMSASALEATERQFTAILNSASDRIPVRLKRYVLPSIFESESSTVYRDLHYESTQSLREGDVDGLIVTGREPLTSSLRDEAYWNSFVDVLEWARDNTYSTIWSCLAAHAAVLHMDGIERVRSVKKHSGLFSCHRVADHPITVNVPAQFPLPHSRWNGLTESDLARCGYQAVTRIESGEVDFFIKPGQSLFLFFQGHPEYQAETLLLEYRRDVGRYLRGESKNYPTIPNGYFDREASSELLRLQREAVEQRAEGTLEKITTLCSAVDKTNGWHAAASTIYRNWLEYIGLQKMLSLRDREASTAKLAVRAHDIAEPVKAEPCEVAVQG